MKKMEVTKKTIGDTTFYIRPFGAFDASNISGELSAVVVPVVTSIAPIVSIFANDKSENVMDMEIDKYLPAIGSALAGVGGNKVELLVKKLIVDYNNISFDDEDGKTSRLTFEDADDIFCGDVFGMYRLCYEVIKVNFKGFFDSIVSLFGSALTRYQNEDQIQSKTTEDLMSVSSPILK